MKHKNTGMMDGFSLGIMQDMTKMGTYGF